MNTRREFLLRSTWVAGAWSLGGALAQTAPSPGFGLWLRFEGQGLRVLHPWTEMGQGTPALLATIVAEELELPLEAITIEAAPVEPKFHNPLLGAYATYGSTGIFSAYRVLSSACAAARDMLCQAAAARWRIEASDCRLVVPGEVQAPDRRRLPIAALIEAASALTPPAKPVAKPRAQWRLLGKVQTRRDLPAKSIGQERYGIDVQLPGMRVACVRHAPGFGGRLLGVDEAPALRQRGVLKVVPLPNAVAVVASGYWAAQQGVQALQPRWAPGAAVQDSERLSQAMRQAVRGGQGKPFGAKAGPPLDPIGTGPALKGAAQHITQEFEFPFLAHAPLEPLNATVQLHVGRAELWVSTQYASGVQEAVAKALGLPLDQIKVHPQSCGGGFGRRIEVDTVLEAVRIAQALGDGQPLKLIWSREEDLRSGHYRPASVVRAQLGLDAAGLPQALRVDLACARIDDYSAAASDPNPDQPDPTSSMGWLEQAYALPKLDLRHSKVDTGVPVVYWRSVGASSNTHAFETLIDLAARRAKQDPLAYRMRLLQADTPLARRSRALLEALSAAWHQALPKHHYRGIALNAANRSVCGHVIEIEKLGARRFRIVRITAALDAGWVLNPDAVEAQLMGGTVFGLTAALRGEISLAKGQVQQSNFHDYRLLMASELPPLDLIVLSNGDKPGGAGEEAVPTVAPALGNALLAASGQVVARLPVTRSGWDWVS